MRSTVLPGGPVGDGTVFHMDKLYAGECSSSANNAT